MLRRTLLASALTTALAALAAGCAPVRAHTAPESTRIAGPLSDIEIIDRDTGQRLPIYFHEGRRYVAGTPGARYAVAVRNRTGARVLAVVAVDGVNAVSGETAAWHQTGYVLDAYQRYEVRGWRKSQARVAAFEFTALSDSYAARTGRPSDVGVIGVALFREAPRPEPAQVAPDVRQDSRLRSSEQANDAAPASAPAPTSSAGAAASAASAEKAEQSRGAADLASAEATAPRRLQERLGTGHGRSETSQVSYTDFERARAQPDQVVTIHYDSRANLIALGVIPRPAPERPVPNPFPGSLGFVPDPPR